MSSAHHDALMADNIRAATNALRQGQAVLLVDAHDREDEGDLVIAAEKINPTSMNFLIQHGSGIVCLALSPEKIAKLSLAPMASHNNNLLSTAFTVSIEARFGITTGVSAQDRALTVKTAMAEHATAHDLVSPGHLFPLAAAQHGLYERMGHTEGSLDLLSIAGLKAGAVLCDLMNSDGTMAKNKDRQAFVKKYNIFEISIEDILCHRIKTEPIFEKITHDFNYLTRISYCFWKNYNFDIFVNKNFAHKNTELKLFESLDMRERFFSLLNNTQKDPLINIIKSLENNNNMLVAIMPDMSVKSQAALCRVLNNLNIMHIINFEGPHEFTKLATNNFGVTFE